MNTCLLRVALASCLTLTGGMAAAQAGPVEEERPGIEDQPPPEVVVPKTTDFETRLRSVVSRRGGMTAASAARMAERTSLDVKAKRAEVVAAQAELDRALVAYAPRLTLTARYVRLSPIDEQSFGPAGVNLVATPSGQGPLPPGAPLVGVPGSALSFPVILDQYTLQAGLVVPVSDYLAKIPNTRRASARASQRVSKELLAARRASRTNGKLLYYEWVRAKLSQVAAQQSVQQATSHLKVVEALKGADRASKADVLRAQAQLARAELVNTRASTLARLTEDRLRTSLHDKSRKPTRSAKTFLLSRRPHRPAAPVRWLQRR